MTIHILCFLQSTLRKYCPPSVISLPPAIFFLLFCYQAGFLVAPSFFLGWCSGLAETFFFFSVTDLENGVIKFIEIYAFASEVGQKVYSFVTTVGLLWHSMKRAITRRSNETWKIRTPLRRAFFSRKKLSRQLSQTSLLLLYSRQQQQHLR